MDGGGSTITEDRRGAVSVGGVSALGLIVLSLVSVRRPNAFEIVPQQRRAPDLQTLQTPQTQETLFKQRRTADSHSQLQDKISRQEHSLVRSMKHLHNPLHKQNIKTTNMIPNKPPPSESSSGSGDVVFRMYVVVSMILVCGSTNGSYTLASKHCSYKRIPLRRTIYHFKRSNRFRKMNAMCSGQKMIAPRRIQFTSRSSCFVLVPG